MPWWERSWRQHGSRAVPGDEVAPWGLCLVEPPAATQEGKKYRKGRESLNSGQSAARS